MNATELAAPDNAADKTILLAISGNRLVSVLNTLDATLHAAGSYWFEGDTLKTKNDSLDRIRETTESIRDELSRQRMTETPPNVCAHCGAARSLVCLNCQ